MKSIHLWGVKQNNLKDIEVNVPLGSFTVVCGPSGSGKSSLAFETLYAEGQRRYIESLSNYSKQFLNKAPKPDLEGIENIPPAISIEQKNSVKSSRSTVGTTTEVSDYLRLLYEKLGQAYCPKHHIALEKDSPATGAQKVIKHFSGKRGYILAKVSEKDRVLSGRKLQEQLQIDGFVRIYTPKKTTKKKTTKKATKKATKKTSKILKSGEDTEIKYFDQVNMGEVVELSKLGKKTVPKTDFYIVIDRVGFRAEDSGRLTDSLSQAFKAYLKYNHAFSGGAKVLTTDGEQIILDERNSCSVCNYDFAEISSRLFSFNNPVGACENCNGFGNVLEIDEDKVIPDKSLTLSQGVLKPFAMPSAKYDRAELNRFCKKHKIDRHTPWEELPEKHKKMIWDGHPDFYGVVGFFEYLEQKKYKMHVRVFLARHKSPKTCNVCKGTRLKPEVQQVLIENTPITELDALTLDKLLKFLEKLKLTEGEQEIAQEILQQLQSRLKFLIDVGVSYLTLNRETKTLSGGEYQRLSLANQLGLGLSQTLYVLDEPTVGLHPRDNDRLISVLHKLKDIGNTLVVVEHDQDVIESSSHIIEIGPGSGHLGGKVIYAGSTREFMETGDTLTANYLKGGRNLFVPQSPRPVEDIEKYKYKVELIGCTGNNLKNINVSFPLNRLVTVTGVSGSGKSTLVSNTLYPILARHLKTDFQKNLDVKEVRGADYVKQLLFIDQSPVGKTARSNPATYMKVFDHIRAIFASLPESKGLGYTPGTFSLNVDGGRCPVCKGMGVEYIDMMFMDDLEVICDVCDGKKYRNEILQIRYKRKNIYEVLQLTVQEAMDFFVSVPQIWRPLSFLKEVGLEYLQLGQSANTLSGGESQRLKVAKELSQSLQKNTLFIMDEPTTGLHFREVELLLKVLNKLVDAGGSVILIEHNMEIIKSSDYIIDIGPEPGAKGGKLIAQGQPLEIAENKKSLTGKYLKKYIDGQMKGSNT